MPVVEESVLVGLPPEVVSSTVLMLALCGRTHGSSKLVDTRRVAYGAGESLRLPGTSPPA
jgi:hypothetical protein